MRASEIHRFELRSRDERDLRNRLATFRSSVQARDGAILDVRWGPQSPLGQFVATVLYELPAGTLPDDAA